jgi:hypothetical protein
MFRSLWLRPLAHRWFGRRGRRASASRAVIAARRRTRPCLESLEDRITPSGVITVTDLADDGTANSLRGAITQSNTDTGTTKDTIQLLAGSYTLSIPNTANNHDVSNSQGDLNITSTSHELDIVGKTDASGKPTTIITVDETKMLDRVFEIGQPGGPSGITVVFKDLIIENGFAQDDGGAGTVAGKSVARGGGILDYGGNVTLSNVDLLSNQAAGGNSSDLAHGTPHYAEGGGIYALNGSLTIKNSVIQQNAADGAHGTTDHPDGQAAYGGGIEYFSQTPPSPAKLNITNSTVSGNKVVGGPTASGGTGGDGDGGGIGITTQSNSTVEAAITDCTISDNIAIGGDGKGKGQGGGVYLAGDNSAPLQFNFINSTIAGNKTVAGSGANSNAFSNGGGIYFAGGGAGLFNDTVADNSTLLNLSPGTISGNGGGIENASTGSSSTIGLTNTLVALNNATANPDYDGLVTVSDHNLIGIADPNSGFNKPNSGDRVGSVTNPLNPLLGPLQNNGGPTQTLALLSGSPAINAGDATALIFTGANDQRGPGFARVVNGTIDIGAFENQTITSPPPSPAPPPTLHTPPLLAFFDALLHGVETINGNDTETVVDRFFGFPLLISTYDGAGNLMSVTLFGINVTLLFELL